MDESTLWWLLAGTTIGIELMIGTFYLLMVATGLAAAAIAAHSGLPMPAQLVTAALVSGGAVVVRFFNEVPHHYRTAAGQRRCGSGVVLH